MAFDEEHSIWDQYYCTDCHEIVGIHPHEHRKEEHEGEALVDIYRIVEKEDGHPIAMDDGMGHFTPHIWTDVGEDAEVCGECGAVKIAATLDELGA